MVDTNKKIQLLVEKFLNEKPKINNGLLFTEEKDFKPCQIITEDIVGVGKKLYIQGIFSEFNTKNQNGRIYPEHVMKPEVLRYYEKYVKTGRALGEANHPECFSEEFQTLTKLGWKEFKDISYEDELATMNIETGNLEYNKIEKIINENYNGQIYKIKGNHINTSVTPNHRFLLIDRYGKKSYHTIEDIYNNRIKFNKHRIPKRLNWDGDSSEFITINGKLFRTDTLMAFVGFYLAEGHCSKSHKNNVIISQNEGIVADEFREILKNLQLEYVERLKKNRDNVIVRFYIKSKELYEYLYPLGKCYDKYIPNELKQYSSPLLSEMLDWFIKGDGRKQKRLSGKNTINLFSTSKKLIEDLHEILIKTGGCGNCTEIITKKDYIFADHLIKAKNKKPLYQLNISTTNGIYLDDRFLKIEKVKHDGKVFCFSVKNGNFYVKQNNKTFITGNSTSIDLNNVSHRIVDLWIEGNYVYGKALIGGPKGDTIKKIIEMGGQLGISSRALGNMNHKNEVTELQIMTWDIVHEPSVASALMSPIVESKQIKESFDWFNDNSGFITESLKREFKIINNNMLLNEEEKIEYAKLYITDFFNSLH